MARKNNPTSAVADGTKTDQLQLIEGKYSIRDLVDLDRLRELFESFSLATGFTTGMLSYPDLEVLVGTGWREICINYHRAYPNSEKFCKQSNQHLLNGFRKAGETGIYRCENGLVDGATPVIVRGRQIASVVTGQVLFEKPDSEQFKKQAETFGFDVDSYLLALSKVPVVTEEQLIYALKFLARIAADIAEQSLDNLLAMETATRIESVVAERERTEASLQAAEAKYQSLIEQSPAIIYTDLAEQFNLTQYISPQVKTITGYSAEEWIADRNLWLKFMQEEDRERVMEEYVRATRNGGPFTSEYRINTKDGRLVWVRDEAVLVRTADGKPSFWQGIMLDISEQKRSEIALQESEEKYRSLVERASDGIVIIQDGVARYVNPRLAQLRGQSVEEITGSRFDQYVHPDERAALHERYRKRIAGEPIPSTYETVLVDKDNNKVYVELSAGIISYEGKPADMIVVRDITERKQGYNVQNAIYEIARAVISTATLDELYQAIHRALENILPVDNFYIALYDPIQNLLSFPYYVDQYDAASAPQRPGHGLTEYVLRTRQPLLATTPIFNDLVRRGEVEPIGADSVDWLGVPLNIGEKIVGVMVIQTYTEKVRLEQRDLEIMSFVSTQVAVAIERVRAEQAMSQRTKELKALYDTSLDIISTHELPVLLETIVERAARLLNASAGGMYLCDPERREVRCVVSYNTPFDYSGLVLKYGDGAAGTVAETGQPLIVDDYRLWDKRARVFDQHKPFSALISVPIIWQGAVQGVLHVLDYSESRRFEEADLALISQFANQAAIAIENARLLEEVQLYASELENRVAERTAELSGRMAQVEELNRAMSELLKDLQEANRRLEETSWKLQSANSELETFAYSVSHDLKAPLRGIDGYSHLLAEDSADKLDEDGKIFLQNIRKATAHMGQLIDDLLTYSRLEQQAVTPRAVNVAEVVQELLGERKEEIERRKIKTAVEIPFKFITCDEEGLTQALRNLIDNALKFTRDTAEAQVQIGGRRTSRVTTLWVVDNGVGFDMKYHDRIFEIFQRLYTSDAYPGTGIGLSIVRKVMQRMGGRAYAESELGKGATFYLEFPTLNKKS
jgi:PAS domain S-box-containing protein